MGLPKLVRDRIPGIIEQDGKIARTHIAEVNSQELREMLLAKLQEEVDEFKMRPMVDELVDILEVVLAIGAFHDVSPARLEQVRQHKLKERGGFSKRIILDAVLS